MERKYKVWLEVSAHAVKKNIHTFRGLLDTKTQLYAVVKSNAYGHGLMQFSEIADKAGVDGFCVDSIVEGIKLRTHGVAKPILVLGYTLPALYAVAAEHGITVTISSVDALVAWSKAKARPQFHLKIDTGMHRQGFNLNELEKLVKGFKRQDLRFKNTLTGIYTHFAMAKNCEDKAFTEKQLAIFKEACAVLEKAGFNNLVRHASATGGTLLGKEFHMDMVRVGIGLYGIWPSAELESQLSGKITLVPALSLHSVISEIKEIKKGEGVGYDMTERVAHDTRLAVIPIGYWHGIPRAASSVGFVWIGKNKAKIIGRVSMDMIVVDVTGISCKVGTEIIIHPLELARSIEASPYEVITRINPLIHKVITR
ncbi:MAG: alanine racemase [bacterium]|nr:alanine racemase [bacterium]